MFTLEEFGDAVTDKVGAGKCIYSISASFLRCNSYALTQMMAVLLSRVRDTGLDQLELIFMKAGGDALPLLNSNSISSLTSLDLTFNENWWKSGDAFQQLLTLLGRQTHLERFVFDDNKLTNLQSTKLLQCIAESNKQLKSLCLG